MTGEVCEHGSLKRSCEICERDEEIAELRARCESQKEEIRVQQERGTNLARSLRVRELADRELQARCEQDTHLINGLLQERQEWRNKAEQAEQDLKDVQRRLKDAGL